MVLHMAAATGRQDVATFVRDNITATFQLIQLCASAGVRRFLYVSSIAAKMADTADSVYADTKKHAEQLVTGSDLQFTIIRPAIVVGRDAPVLRRFVRLATAPVVPVLGGGKDPIQPIWVDDLLDVIRCVLGEGWFEGQVVDAGGPEVITMAGFIKKIRRVYGRKASPMIPVPWGIVMPIFGPIERRVPRALPVSPGELRAFTSNGTADPHPYMARWKGRMKGIDDMLRLALQREL
jgi:NADH dehydrogenase